MFPQICVTGENTDVTIFPPIPFDIEFVFEYRASINDPRLLLNHEGSTGL